MSDELWRVIGQAIVGGTFVTLLGIIINVWLNPKAKAETRKIAQDAARQEVEDRIANLKEAFDEADKRATVAEKRADEAQRRADDLLARVNRLQAGLEEAHEQIDGMAKLNDDLRESNRRLKDQNRMLAESLNRTDQHAQRYFATRGEPMPADWPRVIPFTPEG